MLTIYVGADTLIRWDELKDAASDSFVNNATITFTLKDSSGAVVAGASALPMTYVSNSNGRYQGTLPSTVSLTVGATYFLEITAASGGVNGFRRINCIAQYKGEQ